MADRRVIMIKKIYLLGFMLLIAGVCHGEEMEFVTVLSSPVGAFANLETADSSSPTHAKVVQFGARSTETGTIQIVGTQSSTNYPSLGAVSLKKGTSLSSKNAEDGSSLGAEEMRASRMEVNLKGEVVGGSLLANTMAVNANDTYLELNEEGKGKLVIGENSSSASTSVKTAGAQDKLIIHRDTTAIDQFDRGTQNFDPGMKWRNRIPVKGSPSSTTTFLLEGTAWATATGD